MKKQVARCIRFLFLTVLMCLGMTMTVHAENSGQFFQFEADKLIGGGDDTFKWTDAKGQNWYADEYGTNEAIICAVSEATSMELEVPSYVYRNGVAKKVIGIGAYNAEKDYNDYFGCFQYDGKSDDYMLYKLILPDTLCFVSPNAFNGDWWNNFDGLAAVQFPQNPRLHIGARAFSECSNLQKIYFKDTIGSAQPVKIDQYAFRGCHKLEEVILTPCGAVNEIDFYAFDDCINLKKIVNAPEKLDLGENKVIEEVSFAEGLTEIDGIYSDKSVGENMYQPEPAKTLKTVILPSTLKAIGSEAFSDNKNLEYVKLPDGLTEIGAYAFAGCTSLTGFTSLPAGVSGNIGEAAFMDCKNLHLENVYIHGTDELKYQFKGSGIVSIRIGADVKYTVGGMFKDCKDLREITVDAGHPYLYSKDGVLYSKVYDSTEEVNGGSIFAYPAAKSWAGSYTIPSDVILLGAFAFDSCKFTEIHIPVTVLDLDRDTMMSIGDDNYYYAFDSIKNSCALYVVKNSYIDRLYNDFYSLHYENGPTVSITYNLDGGVNNSSNPSSFTAGTTINLAAPTKTGYTFEYWESANRTNISGSYTPITKELVNGVNLTAHWKKSAQPTKTPEPTKAPENTNTSIPSKLGTVSGTKATNITTDTVKISWKRVAKATGYQINLTTDKKFKKGVKTFTTDKNSAVLYSLKSGKTYYVRVRAIAKGGGKSVTGKYGKAIKFKTFSVPKVKKITVTNKKKGTINIKISPVKGAVGYAYVITSDPDLTDVVKIGTTKKTTATVKNLKKGQTYYVRACAYKLNAQKQKVFGVYNKKVKITIKK